jgi:predicted transposase YbfD/YdcC
MLLKTLSLKGMIDTIDVLNCQREITERIGDQDSD